MILLYLEGSGSKFHSINTKTSQFCQFFGVQELRKKHVNTKTSQFPPFFGFQELTKKMSTPKLVNFPHFWIPGVEKKHVYIYIICIYVHMYITWFCYIWRVVVLSFIPSTPKLVNFLHFLDSRNWEKNMCIYNMYICTYVYYVILLYLEGSGSKFHSVNTKTSQFCQFFGVQELRKKYVNTKTSQFPSFGFQELRKNLYIHIYIYYI